MVDAVYHSTEEGKKVERNAGKKYLYAARRKMDDELIQSVLDLHVFYQTIYRLQSIST